MKYLRAVFFDVGNTLIEQVSDKIAHRLLIQDLAEHCAVSGDLTRLVAAFDVLFTIVYDRTINPNVYLTLEEIHGEALQLLIERELDDKSRALAHSIDMKEMEQKSTALHIRHSRMFDGASYALEKVRSLGLHLGLISDYDTVPMQSILKMHDLDTLIDSLTTSQEIGVYKPSQKVFMAALAKAECEPQEAVYVGDRWLRDIFGAKQVGMQAILIGGERSGTPEPDFILPSIDRLPALLDQIVGA
jgi:HAD superfamily hydrolase (TIGR01549 family)